jgi:hypothetical protein
MADLERTLAPIIEKATRQFRVILLNGQWQVVAVLCMKPERMALSCEAVSIPIWEI